VTPLFQIAKEDCSLLPDICSLLLFPPSSVPEKIKKADGIVCIKDNGGSLTNGDFSPPIKSDSIFC